MVVHAHDHGTDRQLTSRHARRLLGGVAGSLIAGWAWSQGGGRLAFSVAAGAAALGAALAFATMRPGDPATRPAAPPALGDDVP